KGTKLRLSAQAVVASPKLTSRSGLTLDALLDFRWQVALGDQALSLAELRTLARMKAPLVKVRGQWGQLSAEEIQAALDFWKARGESRIAAHEAVRMALGAARPPGGLAFGGVEASGWIAQLIEHLQGAGGFELLEPPEEFHGVLRPYQTRGYSWLEFL